MTDRCDYSDLPSDTCAHCTGRTTTVVGIKALEAATGRPMPQYRTRPRFARGEHGGRPSTPWLGDGKPTWCDHPHPNAAICSDCALQFRHAVTDIPHLLNELETAIRRETAFAERGTRMDGDPDEAALTWAVAQNDPAAKTLAELHRTLLHPDPTARSLWAVDTTAAWMLRWWPAILRRDDLRDLCGYITDAVARCRRVIDRPRDLVYLGICPECAEHARDTNLVAERDADPIVCPHPECPYSATRAHHIQSCVDAGEDRWLTMDELVGAITNAGETVTRGQILRWVRHGGLARETRDVPRWVDGALVADAERVEVYRLGDVRDRAQQAADERDSLTSAEVAVRLGVQQSTITTLVERGMLQPIRPGAKPLRFTEQQVVLFELRKAS